MLFYILYPQACVRVSSSHKVKYVRINLHLATLRHTMAATNSLNACASKIMTVTVDDAGSI